MKISKLFYLFYFMLLINSLIPHSCKSHENHWKQLDNSENERNALERKKRKKKILIYSLIAAGVTAAVATALGLGIHRNRKKQKIKKDKKSSSHMKIKQNKPKEENLTTTSFKSDTSNPNKSVPMHLELEKYSLGSFLNGLIFELTKLTDSGKNVSGNFKLDIDFGNSSNNKHADLLGDNVDQEQFHNDISGILRKWEDSPLKHDTS